MLLGGRGNDRVLGDAGNDVLSGGAGDDLLCGGVGDDTYRFGIGFGRDTVEESDSTPGNSDAVVFGPGVSPDAVDVWRDVVSLHLGLPDPSDRLTVGGWFGEAGARVESFVFADGTVWSWQEVQEMACRVTGTEADDVLTAYAEGSAMAGLAGDDRLVGGPGADTLDGGAGDDLLEGGGGDDVYAFGLGWGRDHLLDEGGEDTIVFAADVSPGQVEVSWGDDGDLVLEVSGGSDRLLVEGYFAGPEHTVERIEFADGTVWTPPTLPAMVVAGSEEGSDDLRGYGRGERLLGFGGDDRLQGFGGDDVLEGGRGDDVLEGGDGDDTLIGSEGNDRLDGGLGDDTYLFGPGDGQDVVLDQLGEDSVVFAPDVLPGDVVVSRGAADLHLSLPGSDDRLTLVDWFLTDATRIERIVFGDGAVWNEAALRDMARHVVGGDGDDALTGYEDDDFLVGGSGNDVLAGGDGDDLLDGGEGNDLLDGGPGGDLLSGGAGGDIYVFGSGFGCDTIFETDSAPESVDRIRMTPQTVVDDVRVTRTLTDLRVYVGSEGDCLTVADWFGDGTYCIESLEFADGTTWDASALLSLAATPTAADDCLVGGVVDEYLAGLEGDDLLFGFGGKDLLEGGPGDDNLEGGNDKDELLGGEGNDRLLGGEGKDELFGGAGDDRLDGGPGDDDLFGGEGSDVYRFEPGGGRDRIFESGEETGDRDCLELAATPLGIRFEAGGSKLDVWLAGGEDCVEVDSWGRGTVFPVEEFRTLDGQGLRAAQVDRLIQAMAAFSVDTGLTWAEAIRERPEEVEAVLAQHWSPTAS